MNNKNFKLKIVFFGTPSFVIPVAESVLANFNLVAVVTTPDTIQGRKKILTPSPITVFAKKNDISVLQPEKLDDAFLQKIKEFSADLFVVAAYGKIIPESMLNLPTFGSINIHPSLLPKYRGPSPIQSALLNGDQVSGITIIKMDAKMDHGSIISQWEFPLTLNDTFAILHVGMFENAAEKLSAIINDYVKEKIQPQPQDDSQATYCHMITRESGYFDSDDPPHPEKLDQMIRAYYPWPTAWTKLQMENGKLQMVKFLSEKRVQIEGGKPIKLEEFYNGHPQIKEKVKKILGDN